MGEKLNYDQQKISNQLCCSINACRCRNCTFTYFYKMSYINTGLLTVIPADLAQYIIFIGALIALVLLLLFELILLVISIKQTKKGEVSGFVKAARFVLPIVFVVSFNIVCLCAFGMTSAKNVLDKEPSVVSQIKDTP